MPALMKRRYRSSNGKAMAKKRRTTGYTRRSGYYGRYSPLGTELKFLDTTWNVNPSATGQIVLDSVNEVAAGTGESQRVGRKVTIKSINMRFVPNLNSTASAANTDDGMRVILYHDKQCNGAAPNVVDILESADYLSFNNLSNKNRFRILMDKYVDLSSASGISATFGKIAKTKQFYMKCNIPIEFSSTTGGIAEIRSNNIGVLCISDKGVSDVNGNVRIRFSDN
jgi:hypothetical protein